MSLNQDFMTDHALAGVTVHLSSPAIAPSQGPAWETVSASSSDGTDVEGALMDGGERTRVRFARTMAHTVLTGNSVQRQLLSVAFGRSLACLAPMFVVLCVANITIGGTLFAIGAAAVEAACCVPWSCPNVNGLNGSMPPSVGAGICLLTEAQAAAMGCSGNHTTLAAELVGGTCGLSAPCTTRDAFAVICFSAGVAAAGFACGALSAAACCRRFVCQTAGYVIAAATLVIAVVLIGVHTDVIGILAAPHQLREAREGQYSSTTFVNCFGNSPARVIAQFSAGKEAIDWATGGVGAVCTAAALFVALHPVVAVKKRAAARELALTVIAELLDVPGPSSPVVW